MLTNEVSLNIYLLAFIILAAATAGFSLRTRLITQCRRKIQELEREILNNYENILELEKETSTMESALQDLKSPVISMKKPAGKEDLHISPGVPDISLRKQLLSKDNLGKHSASGQ
jgi:cell division protein FtsL